MHYNENKIVQFSKIELLKELRKGKKDSLYNFLKLNFSLKVYLFLTVLKHDNKC